MKHYIKGLFFFYLLLLSLFSSCHNIAKEKNKAMLIPSDFFEQRALKLASAIDKGRYSDMTALIHTGVDVNTVGKHGMTLLFFTLAKKDKEALIILLKNGADPNQPLVDGEDSIHITAMAAGMEDSGFLKILLENGADPNGRENDEPALWNVILAGNWENLELLVAHGVNLNLQDKAGNTAIIKLATFNQFRMVSFLIDKGADFSIPNNDGATVAYRVQERKLAPTGEAYKWQQIVKRQLVDRGVKFPVTPPFLNNFGKVKIIEDVLYTNVKYMVDDNPDDFFIIYKGDPEDSSGDISSDKPIMSIWFHDSVLYRLFPKTIESHDPVKFRIGEKYFSLFTGNSLFNLQSGVSREEIEAMMKNEITGKSGDKIPLIVIKETDSGSLRTQ